MKLRDTEMCKCDMCSKYPDRFFDIVCLVYLTSSGFYRTVYSHVTEPREAGEGKRTDALQLVVLRYEAKVVEKRGRRFEGRNIKGCKRLYKCIFFQLYWSFVHKQLWDVTQIKYKNICHLTLTTVLLRWLPHSRRQKRPNIEKGREEWSIFNPAFWSPDKMESQSLEQHQTDASSHGKLYFPTINNEGKYKSNQYHIICFLISFSMPFF